MSEFQRRRGQATTIDFPLIGRGTLNLIASVTIASGDSKISKDQGAFANTGSVFADETLGSYSVPLTSAEARADTIVGRIVDQTVPKEWEDQYFMVRTTGGPEVWASEITSKTDQTKFIIDEGPAVADALLGCTVMVEDASTTTSRSVSTVTGYTVTTREVTVSPAFVDPATLAANDKVTFYPGAPLIGNPAGVSLADDIATVDTVVDGIQTDLSNGTDGLGALKALIDTVDDLLDTEVAAIKTVVDGIQTDLDNGTDGLGALKTLIDALNDITAASVMTTQMTESYAADTVAPTPAQILFMIWAFLHDHGFSGTTRTSRKLNNTTAMTHTLDDATNPTGVTRAT